MARTVTDAAILLGALEGAEPDPNDPATGRCAAPPNRDYTAFLDPNALRGARIGIPRANYYEGVVGPDSVRRGGLAPPARRVMDEVIAVLRAQGAVIVDHADIPSVVTRDRDRSVLLWGVCSGPGGRRGLDADCSIVFKYGMKRDFNAWLASLGDRAPVRTLTELREWNVRNQAAGAIKYGQAQLDISDEMDVARDRERYEADRARDMALAGTEGIDAVMRSERLDALLFPAISGAALSARPGYPTVFVPFALLSAPADAFNPPLPDGFDRPPIPHGVSFAGGACSEPKLIALAYAFEQATRGAGRGRVPPPGLP
jgi:amidase